MKSLQVAHKFFYVVAAITGLTVFYSNHLMNLFGLQFEMVMCIVVVMLLGMFINTIDVLHQVLVKGNTFNGSLTFLRERIPYQMEK